MRTGAAAEGDAPLATSASLADSTRLSENLGVRQLAVGTWVHTSFDDKGTSANGMLVSTATGWVLVDTTWNGAEARQLLDWSRTTLRASIVLAVVTHAFSHTLELLESSPPRARAPRSD